MCSSDLLYVISARQAKTEARISKSVHCYVLRGFGWRRFNRRGAKNAEKIDECKLCGHRASAVWPASVLVAAPLRSAVSQNCILPRIGKQQRARGAFGNPANYKSAIQQIENLRYAAAGRIAVTLLEEIIRARMKYPG